MIDQTIAHYRMTSNSVVKAGREESSAMRKGRRPSYPIDRLPKPHDDSKRADPMERDSISEGLDTLS